MPSDSIRLTVGPLSSASCLILTVNPSSAYPNTGMRERLAVFLFQETILKPLYKGTSIKRGKKSDKDKNRWLIAASAVGIHISIGSVYAWSNFTNPLIEQFGWSSKEVQLTFSLAILFLGLSAAFLGHFVEKHGPKRLVFWQQDFSGPACLEPDWP